MTPFACGLSTVVVVSMVEPFCNLALDRSDETLELDHG